MHCCGKVGQAIRRKQDNRSSAAPCLKCTFVPVGMYLCATCLYATLLIDKFCSANACAVQRYQSVLQITFSFSARLNSKPVVFFYTTWSTAETISHFTGSNQCGLGLFMLKLDSNRRYLHIKTQLASSSRSPDHPLSLPEFL